MSHDFRAQIVLVTAPTDAVITLDEAKQQARIETSEEDALVQDKINEAVDTLDPAAGGKLGRALRPQTWELQLDRFPACEIELPFPPLIEIVSVKYDDANGTEHSLVEDTDFRIVGMASTYKQMIAPLFNRLWPSARCDIGSVRIRFSSGYPVASGDVVDTLPNNIKGFVKLVFADLYTNRAGTIDSRQAMPFDNPNLQRLLDQHMVFTTYPVMHESLRRRRDHYLYPP